MASNFLNLFKKKQKQQTNNLQNKITYVSNSPTWRKNAEQLLYSNLVYKALQMKARFFAKLEARHIREEENKIVKIKDSSLSKLLQKPNEYQTIYDFLSQAYFIRERDKNCFIYVDYFVNNQGLKTYTGLYILLPQETPQIVGNDKQLYWQFKFKDQSNPVLFNFEDVIIWKNEIEDHQLLGGGKFSKIATQDALNSANAYTSLKETITEATKLGCAFDGFLKINAYTANDEKTKAIRDSFVADLIANKGGIPVLDNGTDYVPLTRQLKLVDASTLQEIKSNLLIECGVTLEMLEGNFSKEQKEAFYENHIEPAAISLGQTLTANLFTDWQRTHGDKIVLYPNKIQLMATSEIVQIITATIPAGVFKIDEYREMLGYAPLENEEGQARPRGFNNLDNEQPKAVEEVEQ